MTAAPWLGEAGYAVADLALPIPAWPMALARGVTRNPHLSLRWAARLVTAEPLLTMVREVIGPQAEVENSFLIAKRPGEPFVVPPHQDGINHRVVLDPDRSVTAWVALTTATPEAGCVQVVPGSHRAGYKSHAWGERCAEAAGRPYTLVDPPADSAFVPVSVSAGAVLLMGVQLVHRSPSNATGSLRLGLNIRYVAPGAVASVCP